MNLHNPPTRRTLLTAGAAIGAIAPLALLFGRTPAFAQAAALDVNDPTAKALGYVTASPKPDQKCANCMQYQGKPSDAQAPCTIFGGKLVVGPGWCKSWSQKAGS